ncbi:nitroreductase family protein [Vibrio natriegens]|uniref:nitroreductase family protein n=1 Tax=Vibrio natriegens TaxID=691 RepID=UPI003DA08AC6
MRSFIKKLVEKNLLLINSIYDYLQFKKFYKPLEKNQRGEASLAYWILQDKHRIEKALSLPEPREGFGEAVIRRLASNLSLYGKRDKAYNLGVYALKLYKSYHEENNYRLPEWFEAACLNVDLEDVDHDYSDLVGLHSHQPVVINLEMYGQLIKSRSSCRNYNTEKMIDNQTIHSVIEEAIRTPSVCNRQHWKARIFTGKVKEDILKLQNGNAGFGDTAPYLALITSDLSAFYTENERNQPYTDGGMFAMSFIYSLHARGIASCPLNWCTSYFSERHFRKLDIIPSSEVVVMAIVFGFAQEGALYANSPRFDASKFYSM